MNPTELEISHLVQRIEALQDMADRHPATRESLLATADGLEKRLQQLRARARNEARS